MIEALLKGERGPFEQFENNGTVWRNDIGQLPLKEDGYYTEWSVPGQERVVSGDGGEIYYSPDHYDSFTQVQ